MDDLKCDKYLRFSIATESVLKHLQRYKNQCLQKNNLYSMHFTYLYSLFKDPEGLTFTEIKELTHVDKAFVSRISTDLRRRGLIDYADRGEESVGRYKRKMTLTHEGRMFMSDIAQGVAESVARATEGIPKEELDVVLKYLGKLDENLCSMLNDAEETPPPVLQKYPASLQG